MLQIDDLAVSYGSIQALKGISLHVEPGEIVTLIGANGAGKSTLLKTVSGLIKPLRGRIRFQGAEIKNLPPDRIVNLGISHIPEGRRIFFRLSVEENLELGAYSRGDGAAVGRDREEVFNRFPVLKARKNQAAGTLSGGEQQMLAIGRGLMVHPRLMLLDEPSLGLAPRLVKEIFSIIREINRRGITILLVEQNAHMALEIATRGYVLETGRIVLVGAAAELAQNEMVRKAYLGG